ncbi:MAG: hypothetical protein V1244_03200 [Nitrospinaceae bacterium]|nr:hypothetical protein [Nitrospinaceae bacterium]
MRQDEQSCYQKGEIITVDQGLNRGARVVYLHDTAGLFEGTKPFPAPVTTRLQCVMFG